MNAVKAIIWTIAAGFLASFFLHWMLGFVITAILPLIMRLKPGAAFLLAFTGLFLLWSGLAWWQNLGNESILSQQIGGLFGGITPATLVLLTGFVGGLGGGLTAWCTSFLKM